MELNNLLSLFISILGIFLTIFFVIGTHEAGHFFVARALGIKVLRFSIGFGKTLWSWRDKKGTQYVIALVPLGGYIKMLDETEGNVPANQLHLAFNRQPFYKKFLVVAAGPFVNIVCALLLYWLIFIIGFVTVKPIIGTVTPHSIAAASGLKSNQEIMLIDAKPVLTWANVLFRLMVHAGDRDQVNIEVKNLSTNNIETHVLNLSEWHIDNLSPDLFESIGFQPYAPDIPLVIGVLQKNSPAVLAGLQIGDKVIAINKMPLKTWNDLVLFINARPDETVSFTIVRNGKNLDIPITLTHQRNVFLQKSGHLGIAPTFTWPDNLLRTIQYSPLPAFSHAWQEVVDLTQFNFLLLGKMVTGKLSMQSLGGPITIFESAGTALNAGYLAFISFLAFLSISIGIINILPIPGLDGGHLLIQTVELIIRRPLSIQVLNMLYRLGFAFVIFIFIQALVNDILRLG